MNLTINASKYRQALLMVSPKPKVFVTRILPGNAIEKIRATCEVKVWEGDEPPPRDVLAREIEDVDGLLCLLTEKIDSELLSRAHKLQVISNMAVGFDNIDVAEATRRKILVANTPDVLTETTADYAFALILASARRVVEGELLVRKGDWKTWSPTALLGQDVHGSVLGIIGLGRIGLALARRSKGFQMKLMYYDIARNLSAEKELGIEFANIETLLSKADFISIHANLTRETYHLIGEKQLRLMKKNSILVNTSRGPLVDNMALYSALREGRIAGAALDVTEPEPLPADHPLLTLNNVIVTPHIASASVKTRAAMADIAADNLITALSGGIPKYAVNPTIVDSTA
jgi:glyoxylate reductase